MTADGEELEIKAIRPTRERFTKKQWWVTFVCLVTIALWCIEHEIEEWVGDMGVIALLPIIAFFSTGVLKKVRIYACLCLDFYSHNVLGRFRAIPLDHRL